jgi:hypothetical protein
MEDTIRRYLAQLLQQFAITGIAYYAPGTGHSMAQRLVQVLEEEARRTHLPIQRLNKADVFSGFGVVPVNTRAKLRDQIARIWPVVAVAGQGKVTARQLVLAEAAGAGSADGCLSKERPSCDTESPSLWNQAPPTCGYRSALRRPRFGALLIRTRPMPITIESTSPAVESSVGRLFLA